jgi:hypothetical protein
MSKVSKIIKAIGDCIVKIIRQFKYCKSSCCESECMTKDCESECMTKDSTSPHNTSSLKA